VSAQGEAVVRVIGADIRERMARLYLGNGPDAGLRFAERCVWEIADFVGEVHGAEVTVEMLHRAGDAICLEAVPVIDFERTIEGPEPADPLVTALDGLVGLEAKNRESIAAMAGGMDAMVSAMDAMANSVIAMRRPATLGGRIWAIAAQLQWWPMAFVAGVLVAGAFR
jgi:hypothetical protein